MIVVNWGSSNFRAFWLGPDGELVDEHAEASGVASLDRAGMAAMVAKIAARRPEAGPIYASGMIGSNIGWTEVPYASAPVDVAALARGLTVADIGGTEVRIVPGVACVRAFDGAPDILRGEEMEVFGLDQSPGPRLVGLPGTHTKWVRIKDNRIVDFATSMSGEMFDRLTAQGLLASVVDGDAAVGAVFRDGVALGMERRLGLGSLLFGMRARVIRGALARADAASFLRGLLIGSDIADALALYPDLRSAPIDLVGNPALCLLYTDALTGIGASPRVVSSRDACIAGFRQLAAEA